MDSGYPVNDALRPGFEFRSKSVTPMKIPRSLFAETYQIAEEVKPTYPFDTSRRAHQNRNAQAIDKSIDIADMKQVYIH